jgi:hypothetical protein
VVQQAEDAAPGRVRQRIEHPVIHGRSLLSMIGQRSKYTPGFGGFAGESRVVRIVATEQEQGRQYAEEGEE